MKSSHERKPRRVAEPVQVYLDPPDRSRLERLAAQLGATKSDVLRRSLEALEQQLTDPAAHPAIRIIGIASAHARRRSPGYDVAREHDRFLADHEATSWNAARKGKRGR
ncbi:MAG: ribbon-helix-helix protein, CopG family [Gemmatimonadaceae bacterium]|nr:ribbon-helix-helix protein, CopG family [Gemmatimonadaceae bacterium]